MKVAALSPILNPTVDELLTLVCQELQITTAEQEQAETRYQTLGRVLEMQGSPIAIHGPALYPQGSLRIGTTVRPLGRKEFDLDIVCELRTDARRFPDPPILINSLAVYLSRLPAYVGKVRTKNRCVRVEYPDQFHIDVLPACQDPRNGGTHLLVPDRPSRGWRPSNPKGYAAWFESRAQLIRTVEARKAESIPPNEPVPLKPTLKLATQLFKRWRDLRFAGEKELAPISIVLTTLAGMHYRGTESVSLALLDILEGISAQIPSQGRLVVLNPVNLEEDLSERWNRAPEAYTAFVSGVRGFLEGLRELFVPQALDSVCKQMGKLFGEDLSGTVVRLHAQALEEKRRTNQLSARKHSGTLTGVGGASAVIPVRPHTFYGS